MRSAIAGGKTRTLDFAAVTGKISPRLATLPARAPLRHGARDRRRLRADPALPRARARRDVVDLLRGRHLRRRCSEQLAEYRRAVRAGRRTAELCTRSASRRDALPLEDDSRRPRDHERRLPAHGQAASSADAVAEIARTLQAWRPTFVFDVSFPNSPQPGELLAAPEAGTRFRAPNFIEVLDARSRSRRCCRESGLAAKAGRVTVEPPATRSSCRSASAASGAARAPRELGQSSVASPKRFETAAATASTTYRARSPGTSASVARVLVTGGGGFLGSHLVERLEADGHEVFAARRRDYDLTSMDDGGAPLRRRAAGARLPPRRRGRRHRREPGQPGPLLVREPDDGRARARAVARCTSVDKLVVVGTVCAYPKFTPVPFREDELWNGYPGGDERALRRRQEGGARRARRPTATSTGSERDLPPAGEPLRAGRQLRPRRTRT